MKSILETVRRVWTPGQEIEEITADLSPGTELDSLIRDLFTRLVKQHEGPIVLDMEKPNTGFVHWEFVDFNGHTVVNLHHTEEQDG